MTVQILSAIFAIVAVGSGVERIEVHPESSCPSLRASTRQHVATSFCSVDEAAAYIATTRQAQAATANTINSGVAAVDINSRVDVCLHAGVHSVLKTVQLTSDHSSTAWSACNRTAAAAAAPPPTISGGYAIPPHEWLVPKHYPTGF